MAKRPKRSTPAPHAATYADLSELKGVTQRLKAQAKQAEEARQKQLIRQRQQQEEQNIFRRHVVDVIPLQDDNRALLLPPKPRPIPFKRLQDDQEVMLSSLSDEFDVETLLDTDEALSYRRSGISPEVVRKLRRGHWHLQAELDLHGYRRDDAREALYTFLQASCAQGSRCVRIIHGKGHGSPGKTPILKAHVLSWLMQSQQVLAYTQARAVDGGAGALMVLLKATPLTK